jgi:hypothetical protein
MAQKTPQLEALKDLLSFWDVIAPRALAMALSAGLATAF